MEEVRNTILREINAAFDSKDAEGYRRLMLENPNLYGDERAESVRSRLGLAVELDSPELIDVLVELGADVNAPVRSRDPEGVIEETCLGRGCKIKAARRLLELGAKINFEVEEGVRCRTLIFAITKGDLDMVKLLVQYGAAYNSPERGMTALDHATSRGQHEIAEYLRSIGGKTAAEMGWTPPPKKPEPELSQVIARYFKEEFVKPPVATIQELLPCEPSIKIHILDDGYQFVLQTEGMASQPVATEPGQEDLRYAEIEMKLPSGWPMGDELLKTSENAWPVEWLRRLALEPHLSGVPLGKLFFYPNGSPPVPFAPNTQLSCWMLMLADHDPLYVTEDKQIIIYSAIPLFKEEYELVQRSGIGALMKKFDEHEIASYQMFVRKNVGLM